MKLFEMFATLSMDSSKFDKGIKDSEKNAKSFTKTYTSGFESVVGSIVKFSAIATGALGVLGAMGVNYNTQMETYTTNFTVMLGDAEKAAKKVEELKKFSQSTPFELGDLANATQTLLAFNVSADDSTSILQMLGDISLGNSQKLETLTRAYGKMSSSQKVSLESINMMIDSGYNPLLAIQEKTGESMEQVYDRISKGAVSFEELEDAMKDATSEGGQFYKGMETASKTTAGMISTAKDLINSKLGEFFQGVSDTIKDMLPKVISFVEELDVSAIIGNIEKMYKTFVAWSPVIGAVVGGATALYGVMKLMMIIETVKGMITALQVAMNGMTIAQYALNLAMNLNPMMLIVTLIGVLIGAITALWVSNEDFRVAITEIWNNIVGAIKGSIDSICRFFTETLPNAFNAMINFVKTNWQDILLFIMNPFAGAIKLLYNINPQFREWVNSALKVVKDTFAKVTDIGKDVVKGFWNGISSMGTWITNKVKDFFGGITKTVKNLFGIKSPSRVFKYFGKMVDEGFVGGIEDGASEIKKVMENTFDVWKPNGSVFGNVKLATSTSSSSAKSSGNNIVINVDGSNNPEAVAYEVNRLLGGYI